MKHTNRKEIKCGNQQIDLPAIYGYIRNYHEITETVKNRRTSITQQNQSSQSNTNQSLK